MRTPTPLFLALALSSCAYVTGEQAATLAADALGAAAGAAAAVRLLPGPHPEALAVAPDDAGSWHALWPGDGGRCAAVDDRVCCDPDFFIDGGAQ